MLVEKRLSLLSIGNNEEVPNPEILSLQNAITYYEDIKNEELIEVDNAEKARIKNYTESAGVFDQCEQFLVLDTNIWMFLASNKSQLSILNSNVKSGLYKLLLCEIMKVEWNRHKLQKEKEQVDAAQTMTVGFTDPTHIEQAMGLFSIRQEDIRQRFEIIQDLMDVAIVALNIISWFAN